MVSAGILASSLQVELHPRQQCRQQGVRRGKAYCSGSVLAPHCVAAAVIRLSAAPVALSLPALKYCARCADHSHHTYPGVRSLFVLGCSTWYAYRAHYAVCAPCACGARY